MMTMNATARVRTRPCERIDKRDGRPKLVTVWVHVDSRLDGYMSRPVRWRYSRKSVAPEGRIPCKSPRGPMTL